MSKTGSTSATQSELLRYLRMSTETSEAVPIGLQHCGDLYISRWKTL